MGKKQKANNPLFVQATQMAELLYKLTDKSYEMECTRYDSLMRQSGYLLTVISIVSIAILTAVGLVANAGIGSSCPSLCYVLTLLCIICQIIALIFALCSQFRYRYKQLSSPKELREHCDDLYEQASNTTLCDLPYISARNYADSLQEHYVSVKQRNDIIRILNKSASIALLVSISLTLLDVIIFVVTFKVIL